ncbi:hypothetical protein F2P79_014631 [Pimephales promelas]|nr:hypothetical protein F2P79_014631 [Pimephales promelas]
MLSLVFSSRVPYISVGSVGTVTQPMWMRSVRFLMETEPMKESAVSCVCVVNSLVLLILQLSVVIGCVQSCGSNGVRNPEGNAGNLEKL